jgi:C-5 cytosine-specific DNA methylase
VQLEGFPKYPWSHMIPAFLQMDRKMTLALPCLGMDALSAGLREIHWDGFEIAYAYDIDESLIPTLLHMHGPDANLHIGRRTSYVLASNEEEWSRVDWVIAGPPCPPLSSIGANRAPEDDPREAVFRKVTKIIISQGRKICFGFIVEMVFTELGSSHRRTDRQRDENVSADRLFKRSREACCSRCDGVGGLPTR